ncbi:ATP-binding cassette domain-containing protein [Pseudoglutamicibacter albus]|uniref:ATP-binding cassette domain-containing protein n=1 Tax=Pseudoglutamicibacter albus TaxID=98671 RepID=UPI00360839F6
MAALVLGAAAGADPRLLALAVLLLLAVDEPLGQLAEALRQVPVLSSMLASVAPYLENRSVTAIETEPEPHEEAPAGADAAHRVDSVRVRDLSAAYAPEDPPVFGPVSGGVEQGEMWAVTGPSGSGKSTMIAVMLGFLTPRTGTVQARTDGAWVTLAQAPDAAAGSQGTYPRRLWLASRGVRRTGTCSTPRCAVTSRLAAIKVIRSRMRKCTRL